MQVSVKKGRMRVILKCILLIAITSQVSHGTNVLVNPSFEEESIRIVGGIEREWVKSAWNIRLSSVPTGTWDESTFHSDGRGGAPEYNHGANALRVFGFGTGGT